ncbi:MAG: hypothetical protein AAF721_19840 [Myxococcota bacterium]
MAMSLVALLLGCTDGGSAAGPAPAPEPPPPAERVERAALKPVVPLARPTILIRGDRPFYGTADAEEPLPPPAQGDGEPRIYAMNVIGRAGNRVRVSLNDEPNCAPPLEQRPQRVEYFVELSDVELATTRAIRRDFADGTHVRVERGVRLVDAGDGEFIADALGVRVQLPVPPRARGRIFDYATPMALADSGVWFSSRTEFDYGEGRYARVPGPHREDSATGIVRDAGGTSAQIDNGCLGFSARVNRLAGPKPPNDNSHRERLQSMAEHALLGTSRGILHYGPGCGFDEDAPPPPITALAVDPGAPVYWPDGSEAGVVLREIVFAGEPGVAHGGECFSRTSFFGAPIDLCFDAHDLRPSYPYCGAVAKPVARVLRRQTSTTGTLTIPAVREAFMALSGPLQRCHQRALRKFWLEEGEVTVIARVLDDGETQAEVLEPPFPREALAQCVTNHLGALHLDGAPGSTATQVLAFIRTAVPPAGG